MKFFQNMSIAIKITGITTLAVFILLVIGCIIFLNFEKKLMNSFSNEYIKQINHFVNEQENTSRQSLEHMIHFNSKMLLHIGVHHLMNFDIKGLQDSLMPYISINDINAIIITDEQGRPTAAAWKESGKSQIDVELPQSVNLDNCKCVSFDFINETQFLGKLSICYTDDILKQKISSFRNIAMENSTSFIQDIKLKFKKAIVFQFFNGLLIIVILIVLLVSIIRWFVVKPFKKVSEISNKMASFDLTFEIIEYKSKDETGNMFRALNTMLFEYRKIASEVLDSSMIMVSSAKAMKDTITSISTSFNQIKTSISDIHYLTEKMSDKSNIIAGTIEELSSSIDYIANNARSGSDIAKKAVLLSLEAKEAISVLGESAFKIGDVTEVIKSIADKTTLLALNADIEAASVGDAGRGFGVVANEIKEFAQKSTLAAENIDFKISSMQEKTQKTISVISKTTDIIGSIDISSDNISLSLDEQRKALEEMSNNFNTARINIQEIVDSMSQLDEGANEIAIRTGIIAHNTESQNEPLLDKGIITSAGQIHHLANDLLNMVKKFKL